MINAEQLVAFKLFSDLSPSHLDAIAGECQLLEFSDTDIIFKHGETARTIYGVLEGEIALSLVFEDKVLKADIDYEESLQRRFEVFEKPIVVEVVHSGEIFGWSALVSPHISTATATCRGPVKLFAISGDAMRRLFAEDAELGFSVMNRLSELISQRLRRRTDKLIETWGVAFGTDQL
jgi:CRP-like cAMP-binding protein